MQQHDLQGSTADVEQIGTMLAEAFIARIARFTPADRIKLLQSCRTTLEAHPDIADVFFRP